MTTTGTLAFAGRAKVEAERLSFSLRTVEHAGAVPVEIEGTYHRGQLRLERARSEVRRRSKLDPRPRNRQR